MQKSITIILSLTLLIAGLTKNNIIKTALNSNLINTSVDTTSYLSLLPSYLKAETFNYVAEATAANILNSNDLEAAIYALDKFITNHDDSNTVKLLDIINTAPENYSIELLLNAIDKENLELTKILLKAGVKLNLWDANPEYQIFKQLKLALNALNDAKCTFNFDINEFKNFQTFTKELNSPELASQELDSQKEKKLDSKKSALLLAIEKNNKKAVELILEANAKKEIYYQIAASELQQALNIAKKLGNKKIVTLLKKFSQLN